MIGLNGRQGRHQLIDDNLLRRAAWAVLAAGMAMAPGPGGAADPAPAARVLGRLEHVRILEGAPLDIPGRLDEPGQQTVLYARDIKYFSGEGGMWVSFTVDSGQAVPLKQVILKEPVLKDQRIKERTGGITHRPLVKLNLCVGSTTLATEVSIRERTSFTAPLVFGSADVARLGTVDPQKQFAAGDPTCKAPAATAPAQTVDE